MIVCCVLLGVFLALYCLAAFCKEPKRINEENPYLHSEKKNVLPVDMQRYVREIVKPERKQSVYEKVVKRIADILLSFFGLVILSPLYLLLCIVIIIDDPGPIFFRQKRVGKGCSFFYLHKFRSMKMSTPHDIPTHILENPDQYITKVGKFLRKASLDELPQIWDIFRGKMSVIGPRPALWNQADLVLERERYGANDVMPGLTGWAQINGRDELGIPVKAKLDGEYCEKISFLFDCRCFIGTVFSVVRGDGVVEGGTGNIYPTHSTNSNDNKTIGMEDLYQIQEPKK